MNTKEIITNENVPAAYTTAEFWVTLISTIVPNLITILAIMKIVPEEIVSTLSAALVALIGGLITAFVAFKYISSRSHLKEKIMDINLARECNQKQHLLILHEKGLVKNDMIRKVFNI